MVFTPMTNEQIKEALSRHFVCSVAHLHGVKCLTPEPDNGVDITFCPVLKITKPDGTVRYLDSANKLDVQIKSTIANSIIDGIVDIKFDLEAKSFNDLIYRRNDPLPLHLVVVVFDEAPPSCLNVRPQELALLGKAYWYLPDQNSALTANTNTVRITIPKANQVGVGFVPMIYTAQGYSI